MAILSNRDFYKELGSNLLIFPFKKKNIKGASINLCISEFAWDLNTKKKLLKNKNILIVPPFTAIAIMTDEVIYVGEKICGSYHSKVRMTFEGFSSISTTLDPGYIGTSLICLNNNTPIQHELEIGSAFATLMLSYVNQSTLKEMIERPNTPGQIELINKFDSGNIFFEKQRNDGYHYDISELRKKMNSDSGYKAWRADFSSKDPILKEKENIESKEKENKIESDNKKRNWKKNMIKITLHLVAWAIIIFIAYLVIVLIASNNSFKFLKEYLPIVALALSYPINNVITKIISFVEKLIDGKQTEGKR